MGISDRMEYGRESLVEFRTNQIRPFKTLFDTIKNNLPDTSIYFSTEGMKIMQLDSASNFLVNVDLPGENFEHYYCDSASCGEGDGFIEVNLSAIHLNKAFKAYTNDDNLLRFVYEKGADRVKIILSSEKKSECRTYEIPIQNPEEQSQIAEFSGTQDFPYSLTMPCADLQRICRDFKTHGCEKISITHDGNSLKFSAIGIVNSTIERHGNKSGGSVQFVKMPEIDENTPPYKDEFKFSTLNEFSKCQAGGDSKLVRILLSQGDPIVLYFEIGTLGTMAVAIAPHVRPEDI